MPSGLPALLSFSSSFGSLVRNGLPDLVVAEPGAPGAAHHLLGRDAVGLLGVCAHEILATAGDDVGLVAVGAQVLQHLLHRLVGELGIGPLPAWILRRFQPLPGFRIELVHRHAGERRGEDLFQVVHRELRYRLAVAGQHGLEWLDLRKLRFRLDHRGHAVQAVDHLRVHRMFHPQGTVLVEGGDALRRRHEAWVCAVCRRAHEIEDGLLCRTVVPGCKWCGLRLRFGGAEKFGQQRQRSERAEYEAPVRANGKGR